MTWDLLNDRHPTERIIDYAQQLQSPTIVRGTHGHCHDGPMALGQTSVAVVHRSLHPVLVVPPLRAHSPSTARSPVAHRRRHRVGGERGALGVVHGRARHHPAPGPFAGSRPCRSALRRP